MSKLETNTIDTISGSTNLTIGSTNSSTVTFESGAATGHMYPAFAAKMSSNQNIAGNTNVKINFDSEIIDTDNAYDHSSNYRFTVPSGKAGKYMFSLQLFSRSSSVGNLNFTCLKIYKNGSQLLTGIHNDNDNLSYGHTPNVIVMDDASVGDYYEPYILAYSASTQVVIDTTDQGGCDHFNGYRIGS